MPGTGPEDRPKDGVPGLLPVSGQNLFPEALDSQMLNILSNGIAQSAAKFSNDIRLLQRRRGGGTL